MNFPANTAIGQNKITPPVWMQELQVGLSVRSQFVMSGNIHDVYPTHNSGFQSSFDAIWSVLATNGFDALLVYDPVDGLKVQKETRQDTQTLLQAQGIPFDNKPFDLDTLLKIIKQVTAFESMRVGLIIDYASHLTQNPNELDETERKFFVAIDKLANQMEPFSPLNGTRPPFNPVFWVVDYLNKMPNWFIVDNENIRLLSMGAPDLETRFEMATQLSLQFMDSKTLSPQERKDANAIFALETEGMTLSCMRSIARLANFENIGLADISDAVKAYQFGTQTNPWKSEVMRTRIRNGQALLSERVKGQSHAIRKTLDILIRSVMGLSGAQSNSRHGRPRGVLFFAGPTGVGKTELAKAVTELLFGDETAYHRYDMSEFTTEHSESRLIGAPPGYTGHDRGGELVNAARTRPFSVFLFDEIEKAHPRILDKFLQIIDEGRLTDGMGKTVNFSSSLIIFTSNIGLMGGDSAMNHGMRVLPGESYQDSETKIVRAIQDHFRYKLERPELLNRIGRNIVVFEFIKGRTSVLIFENMLSKILETVADERNIRVTLSETAQNTLQDLCCQDLFEGGRGIGNRLEVYFINPLARLLFETDVQEDETVLINSITQVDNETVLKL